MWLTRTVITLVWLMIMAGAANACEATPRNSALLASSCAACHGTNGHSVGITPSLAGLDRDYFIKQMQDFRTGERPSTVMKQHAMGYTTEEIRLMAEFFAKQ